MCIWLVLPCLLSAVLISESQINQTYNGYLDKVARHSDIQVTAKGVTYVLDKLGWKTFIVIVDNGTEYFISKVLFGLENCNQYTAYLTHMYNTNRNVLFIDKAFTRLPNYNILVAISSASPSSGSTKVMYFQDVIGIPLTNMDRIFSVKSKWLFFDSHQWSIGDMEALSSFAKNLANVAIIIPKNQSMITKTWVKISNSGIFRPMCNNLSEINIFPNLKYKLNRKHLLVAVLALHGSDYDIFAEIVKLASLFLNFTYTVVRPPDGLFGDNSSWTWNGMVGQLIRNEVDFACRLTMTHERSAVIDFIWPALSTTQPGLLYRKQIPTRVSWYLFCRPFQTEVYVYILISYIAVSGLLLLLSCNESKDTFIHNVSQTWFLTLGCLFLECNRTSYTRLSVRILLVSWWCFCVIIAAIYTGNLTSALIPGESKTFNTIKEVLEKPEWHIGVLGGSADISLLSESQSDDIKLVWNAIVKRSEQYPFILSPNASEHLERVLHGNYAFFVHEGEEMLRMRNDCVLDFKRNILGVSTYHSLAVPMNSLLKRDLESFSTMIHANGILEHINTNTDRRPNGCSVNDEPVKPLFIENVKGVLVALVAGMVVSVVSLFIELCIYNRRYTI